MDHMHQHGIFHRDIKPENILVNKDSLKVLYLSKYFLVLKVKIAPVQPVLLLRNSFTFLLAVPFPWKYVGWIKLGKWQYSHSYLLMSRFSPLVHNVGHIWNVAFSPFQDNIEPNRKTESGCIIAKCRVVVSYAFLEGNWSPVSHSTLFCAVLWGNSTSSTLIELLFWILVKLFTHCLLCGMLWQ